MSKLKSLSDRKRLVVEVFEALRRVNPDPRCELYFRTEFQLLVSVVLSAQTTDKKVNQCMTSLYDSDFTPETVVQWGPEKLLQYIKPIGLAPTKSKNVYALSQRLLKDFQGKVPHTREDLESLPGVGRKTANVILGEIFRHPTIAVDTHVFRVTKRLGLQNEATPEKAEQVLLKLIDPSYLPAGHHWFILLGRYTCKAQKPLCGECPVAHLCPSCLVVSESKTVRTIRTAKLKNPHNQYS